MNLYIFRDILTEHSTAGKLHIESAFYCYTLELPIKDGLPGSAIPEGTFPVSMRWSPKFGMNTPHIDNIPNRSLIEIHYGNTTADTNGCVLVGLTRSDNFIGRSRDAFTGLYPQIMKALGIGKVFLTVSKEVASNHDAVAQAATGES